MPLPEVRVLKQQIDHLILHDEFRVAAHALESFTNRLTNLNRRIDQLPFEDRSAMKCVLYIELEKVLARFEELEWLGPQSGPVKAEGYRASDAIHAYSVRIDKIEQRLDQTTLERRLATFTVLHRESGTVLVPFERHRSLRRRGHNPIFLPQSRLRLN